MPGTGYWRRLKMNSVEMLIRKVSTPGCRCGEFEISNVFTLSKDFVIEKSILKHNSINFIICFLVANYHSYSKYI